MWKTHSNVDDKGIIFHRGCENQCGKLSRLVDITTFDKDFHISTGCLFLVPVEMWKSRTQTLYTKSLIEKRTVENS
jgi:hypothetical protein